MPERREQTAVIVGVTSGIGQALTRVFAERGYRLGLASRRIQLLKEQAASLPVKTALCELDLCDTDKARRAFSTFLDKLGEVDVVILNSGVNLPNPDFEWPPELETMQINAIGFMALSNLAIRHFLNQGRGHLVGISSVAALRGTGRSPAYSASKACLSNYLEGLRQKLHGSGIAISDIRPGYVKTSMIADHKHVFWAASPEKAARQIYDAIRKKKKVAYVTRRWIIPALVFKHLPDALYQWGYERFGR